jgi:hypothetical protein
MWVFSPSVNVLVKVLLNVLMDVSMYVVAATWVGAGHDGAIARATAIRREHPVPPAPC